MFKFPTLTPGSHCSGLCFYIFFPDCHINGIFYITFWDRVLSVTVTNLNCIPVVACINSSFLSCSVAAAAAKSLQSCPTLCDPIDGSPSGSSVPGILQARTLEWIAISFSNAWKRKVKVKSLSRARLLATPWTAAYQAPPSMGFSRQEYWSGVPSLHNLFIHSPTDRHLSGFHSFMSYTAINTYAYVYKSININFYFSGIKP